MAKTGSRIHALEQAVAEVASDEGTKATSGPAAPIALLLGDAKKLKKRAKKDRKRTKKQAKKTAKLERKALRTRADAERTRPGAGRPPAAPLKAGRTGFSAKRTDLVKRSATGGVAVAAQRTDLVDHPEHDEVKVAAQRTDLVDHPEDDEVKVAAQRTDLVDHPEDDEVKVAAQRTDLVDHPEDDEVKVAAQRTDLVELSDDEPAVADAEGKFDTDPDADLDAQAAADAERAARAAAAETEAETDTDLDEKDEDGSDDDVDDEFEALLGRGSFSADRGKATSFLAPGPKATKATADKDTGTGTGTDTEDPAASTEPAAEPADEEKSAEVGELCRHIATWWRVLTPSAGALTVTDLKWLGGRLEPAQWKDLEQVAADEHKSLVARLAEQKLDVTDEGVLMHDVDGKPEPLPVDDDGNPIAATAAGAPEARAAARVEFRSGKFFRAKTAEGDEVLVDTADSFSADGGAGWENVTVDKTGTFYLTSQQPGDDQVDVVDTADVVMRGQIKVSLGAIGTLSNRADPDPVDGEGLRAALTHLQTQGSKLQFKVVEIVDDVRTTAREFLADAAEAETVAAASPGTVAALKSVELWRELADEVGAAELATIIEKRGWRGTGTEIQDEDGEPVDPSLARELLKKELAELEATKAAAKESTPTAKAKSAAAAP